MSKIDFKIRAILDRGIIDLGFNYYFKGTHFIVDIIMIAVERGERFLQEPCTKVIYPEIAKKHATTAQAVERCIRYAISDAWLRGDLDRLWSIFPRCCADETRPKNMEFIQHFSRKILPSVYEYLRNDFTISGKSSEIW